MKGLLGYLREHPLVWIVPLLVIGVLVVGLAWKLAHTPSSPFIYDI